MGLAATQPAIAMGLASTKISLPPMMIGTDTLDRREKRREKPPTVAILINNRNNAAYLHECVESALNQTHPANEIIVCDNESTDDSLSLLHQFGDRIVLLENAHDAARAPRENAARAQHRAFLKASSEWLFFLDGDDVFHPQKIETYLQTLAGRQDALLIQGDIASIDPEGNEIPIWRDDRLQVSDHLQQVYRSHDCDLFFPTSSLAVHRTLLESELPLDFSHFPQLAADTRMAIAALFQGSIVNVPQRLTSWRQRPGSLSSISAAQRFYLPTLTRERTALFNHCARRHGAKPISLWRNARFYRQLGAAILPRTLTNMVRQTNLI